MRSFQTKNKVLLIFVLSTLTPFLCVAVFLFFKKRSVTEELLLKYAKLRKQAFETSVASAGIQLLGAADVFARTDLIRLYYEQVGSDTIRNTQKLKENFSKRIGNQILLEESKYRKGYDIQLFIPPAKNIFKSWALASGEDASLLRKSILHVNAFQKPIWALELGRSGLSLRGISPVKSRDGHLFVGTMEIIGRLNGLLKELSSDNEKWAMYMLDRNFRLISSSERDRSADFHKVGRYVFVQGQALEFNSNLFKEEEFDAVLTGDQKDIHFSKRGGKWNFSFPVVDFSGKTVGIAVFQANNTIVDNVVPSLIEEVLFLVIFLIFTLIFFLSRYFSSPTYVTGTDHIVPRFLVYFNEISDILRKAQKDSVEFKEIAKAIEEFFVNKGNVNIGAEHRLGRVWKAFVRDYTTEVERIEQLNVELYEKDWLTQANRRIDAVLHKEYSSLKELMDAVLREYIDLLKVQAGTIYLANNEKKIISSVSTYVAKRNVIDDQEIAFGDGLVGSLAVEKKRRLISDVPDGYFEIISGLGQTSPRQILLEPMISHGKLVAIMEFGTINVIDYSGLELLNSSVEQVAVRLRMFDITMQATALLKTSKETEKELEETQNELKGLEVDHAYTNKKLEAVITKEEVLSNLLHKAALYTRYDGTGRVVEVGDMWEQIVEIPISEIIGTSFYDGIDFDKFEYQKQQMFWNGLLDGELHRRTMTYDIYGKDITLSEAFLGEIEDGKLKSVIKLAFAMQ